MKAITIKLSAIILAGTLAVSSCKKSDDPMAPAATVYYQQQDQMGRPAINTVFIAAANKDAFNTTIPSQQNAAFASEISAKLTAFGYTSNILGLNNAAFTGVLATDVLSASTTGVTSFYDGTNVLTGRTLSDDVIDVELTLIFGGAAGTSNPGLTSDHVNANDKAFSASFPYLASPW